MGAIGIVLISFAVSYTLFNNDLPGYCRVITTLGQVQSVPCTTPGITNPPAGDNDRSGGR
jgi:hypothetical protein